MLALRRFAGAEAVLHVVTITMKRCFFFAGEGTLAELTIEIKSVWRVAPNRCLASASTRALDAKAAFRIWRWELGSCCQH